MQTAWDAEIAAFLTRLSTVQQRTLEVLMRKREAIVAADSAALVAAGQVEQEIITSLQECLDDRQRLLNRARAEGLPSQSLHRLTEALPHNLRKGLTEQVRQATQRARLLHHHSVVNWVVVQRTVLHLSQLLEIIATGGRLRPTYGRESRNQASGALVDRAV